MYAVNRLEGTVALDPNWGVLRWTWHRVGRHGWVSGLIGGVLFSAATLLSSRFISNSWGTSLERGLSAIGFGVASVFILAIFFALFVAPIEQRNALRSLRNQLEIDLVESGVSTQQALDSLKLEFDDYRKLSETPVASDDHAELLRRIAVSIQTSLTKGNRCDYSDGSNHSPLLRTAFADHFPSIVPELDAWDECHAHESDIRTTLAIRLNQELVRQGMNDLPWQSHSFFDPLIGMVTSRAMSQTIAPLQFDWHAFSGGWYWGTPSSNNLILGQVGTAEEQERRKQRFERIVNMMDSWPEVGLVRPAYLARIQQQEKTNRALEFVLLRDRFYGSCPLCAKSVS